jgi:hypothetical protein
VPLKQVFLPVLLIIIPPLLHSQTHLSLPVEVCDSLEQAAHRGFISDPALGWSRVKVLYIYIYIYSYELKFNTILLPTPRFPNCCLSLVVSWPKLCMNLCCNICALYVQPISSLRIVTTPHVPLCCFIGLFLVFKYLFITVLE